MSAILTRFTPRTIPFLRRISLYNRRLLHRYVYCNINSALAELEKRRSRTSVSEDLKKSEIFPQPMFCLFRHVATPNFEIDLFIKTCLKHKIKGLIWEYYSDKFTSNNVNKHNLAKMPFFLGRGKKGGLKIKSLTIIDFNTYNGKKISEVQTLWNEPLTDFHHSLFNETYPNQDQITFYDASMWLRHNGGDAQHYYENFLENFLFRAILLENFVTSQPEERKFIHSIFLPAFYATFKKFKYKPLIAPLLPLTTEGDQYWTCYNSEILEKTERRLKK